MKKFIVIYRATKSAMEKMEKMKNLNPEEMKKTMEPWMVWAKNCGDGLVDIGTPLGNGHKVSSDGTSQNLWGIVGYSVLQAKNIENALKMLKEHPYLTFGDGCEIEVYESMPH